MFKYNTLSDLKDGTCVVPIRKEGEFIICKDEDEKEVSKTLDDFDFAKKPEERGFELTDEVIHIMEEDLLDKSIMEENIPVVEEDTLDKEIMEENIPVRMFIRDIVAPSWLEIAKALQNRKDTKISVETQVIRGQQ